MTYKPTFLPDGRKAYNPRRTERDIFDEWAAWQDYVLDNEPDCPFPAMRAKELWRQEEEKGERWSDWQKRVWFPACRASSQSQFDANETERNIGLTKEELERLVEHFGNANDPVTRSIATKALAMLKSE